MAKALWTYVIPKTGWSQRPLVRAAAGNVANSRGHPVSTEMHARRANSVLAKGVQMIQNIIHFNISTTNIQRLLTHIGYR